MFFYIVLFNSLILRLMLVTWDLLKVVLEPTSKLQLKISGGAKQMTPCETSYSLPANLYKLRISIFLALTQQ